LLRKVPYRFKNNLKGREKGNWRNKGKELEVETAAEGELGRENRLKKDFLLGS